MKNEMGGINPDCYGCLINQARSTAKQANLDRTQTQDTLDAALRWILIARYNPIQVQHIVRHVADVVQDIISKPNWDIYAEIKKRSHDIALSFVDDFKMQIQQSSSPVETGIRIAAAGNIIDFGAKDHASLDLNAELGSINKLQFGRYDIDEFFSRIANATTLLYICDNVGEIIFDRMLIEFLRNFYPRLHVIAAMRHSPIINDATVEDAKTAGLDQVATVISSGSIYPGTILNECTNEFQRHFRLADVVIAKGQGNFETLLSDCNERLFFLLRIKCDTMAHVAGQKKGDLIFMQGNIK